MSKYFDGELLSGHEKSPKTTIFGEEHFIDTTMINLIEQRNNAIDNFVFEQMENVIKGSGFIQMPQVVIDKDKLRKWIVLCMKLENIEHSELVDMATKKRILDLEAKLAESEKRLVNCVDFDTWQKTVKENKQLKQQLAESNESHHKNIIELTKIATEKDRKIEELKQQLAEKENFIKDLMTGRLKPVIPRIKEIEKQHQDKISFAVEKLEKVKKDIDCYMAIREGDLPYNIECLLLDFANKIDNQIEELKKEMK